MSIRQSLLNLNLTQLIWFHILAISLGLRTDQIFGIYTLFLTFVVILYYAINRDLPPIGFPIPVSVLIGFYLLLWFISIFSEYYSLEWDLWDTGIHANNIVNFAKKGSYFSSVLNMPALQDHFTPALLLLSPVFQIEPSILYLPLLRWATYALSFVFLYKILKILFNEKNTRKWLLLLWLFNSAIHGMLTFEFQGSNVSPLFVFAAFYFYLRKKPTVVFFILFALTLFKENLVLGLFSFGLLYLIQDKQKKTGILFIITSIFLAFFIYYLVFHFAQGSISQKQKWGPLEHIPKKIFFILHLGSLFLFIPFLRIKLAIVFISSMALSLISKLSYMAEIGSHYPDLPACFGMITTALALKELQEQKDFFIKINQSFAKPLAVILFLWLNAKTPAQDILRLLPNDLDIKIHAEVQLLKKDLPKDSPIASQTNLACLFIEYPNLKGLLLQDFEILLRGEIPPQWPRGTTLIYAEKLHSWPLANKSVPELTEALRKARFYEIKKPYLSELRVFALHQ